MGRRVSYRFLISRRHMAAAPASVPPLNADHAGRISPDKQDRSGLGLEAQREAVQSYLDSGSWTLAAEVTEVESGKRNDRPELDRALRLCRLYEATLVVAKLDRLARNVAFISKLMESGVDFVAVDFPQANRLTVHILERSRHHHSKIRTG